MSTCLLPVAELTIMILLFLKYPDYGRDIFHCLKRYSTVRPCDIDFHDKARATLTSIVMRIHIRLGRAIYKSFEFISVVSVILFLIFLLYLGLGLIECVFLFLL
ncbi:MAG: hypothetical protein ACXADL_12360 [Candidatus Thorarchaeota archaeon]|jgi:hypothetical protein